MDGRGEASGRDRLDAGLIDKLLHNKRRAPDSVELWAKMEEQFGGPEAFAIEMKKCYDACADGSPSKARMMSLMLEMRAQAERQKSGDVTDGLSNEDLENVLKFMLKQAANG